MRNKALVKFFADPTRTAALQDSQTPPLALIPNDEAFATADLSVLLSRPGALHFAAGDQGLVEHEWKDASDDRGGNHWDIRSTNIP